MKNNFLRILLMSAALSTGLNLVAMECEPMDTCTDDVVTLQSSDGQAFKVSARVAMRSQTIKNLIEDAGIDAPIPLPNINGKTLTTLIPLLRELDVLLSNNEKLNPEKQIYIPRKLQPTINEALAKTSLNDVVDLFVAANYLDIPFLLNGFAAVIANRVPEGAREDVLKALQMTMTNEGRQETATLLKKHHLGAILQLDKNTWKYIVRHLVHRERNITQEYSIADYIAEHGQPRLHDNAIDLSRNNTIDLSRNKLTSLFGMAMLGQREQIHRLLITDNCLFDLTLDVQAAHEPFAQLANLQMLDLSDNQLNNLPEQIFAHLTNLQMLLLDYNQLSNLPEQIFAHLTNLQRLYLNSNHLNNLHEQIFAPLANLQVLALGNNQLNNLPEQIFARLANLQVLYLRKNQLNNLHEQLFAHLADLRSLDLGKNQLKNLPEQLFAHLTNLKELELNDNQLSNLPEQIFAYLANLRELRLYGNQLNNLPEQIFARLANLRELYLRNNQLSENDKKTIKEKLPRTRILW